MASSDQQVAMAVDGLADGNIKDATGQSAHNENKGPIIVSANRYFDIKPYMDINYREDPKKWGSIFPWEFPQNATQEQEDAFLIRQFGELECNVQGFRFLKQCWYCAALHNYENRVPLAARDWRSKNESFYDLEKPAVLEAMCKDNAEPIAFFPEEMDLYGEKFLRVVMEAIQAEARIFLATKQPSPQAPPPQQAQAPTIQQNHQLSQSDDATPKPGYATAFGDDVAAFDASSDAPGVLSPPSPDGSPEHPNLVPAKHAISDIELRDEADVPNMPVAHETDSSIAAKSITVADTPDGQRHIDGDASESQAYHDYAPRFGHDRDNVGNKPYESEKNRRQSHHQAYFPDPYAAAAQSQICDPAATGYTGVNNFAGPHNYYGVPPKKGPSYGFVDHRSFQTGPQGHVSYNGPNNGKGGIYVPRSLMESPHHDTSYQNQQQDLQQVASYDQSAVMPYRVPSRASMQAHQQYESPFQEKTNHRSQTSRKFSTESASQYGETKMRRYGQYSHPRGAKARGSSREFHGRRTEDRLSSWSNDSQTEQGQVDRRNPVNMSSAMPDRDAAAKAHHDFDHHHKDWHSMATFRQEDSTANNEYAIPPQPTPSHRPTQMHSNDPSHRLYRLGGEHKFAKKPGFDDQPRLFDATLNNLPLYAGAADLHRRPIPHHLLNSHFIHPDITHVTKVIVFGIAATAPRHDVDQLFSQFGNIVSLRAKFGNPIPMIFITYENTVQVRTALTHDGMTLPDGKVLRVQVQKEYWDPAFKGYPGDEFRAMPYAYREFWTRSDLPTSHGASPHPGLAIPSHTAVPGHWNSYMNPGPLAKASDGLMPSKSSKDSLRKQASAIQKKGKSKKNQKDFGDVKDSPDEDLTVAGLQQSDTLEERDIDIQPVPPTPPAVSPGSETKPDSDEPITHSTDIAVSTSVGKSELKGTASDQYAIEENLPIHQSPSPTEQPGPFRDETTTPEKENSAVLVSKLPEHEAVSRTTSRALDGSPDEKSFHTATDSPESNRNQASDNFAKDDDDVFSQATTVDVVVTPAPARSKAVSDVFPDVDDAKAPASPSPVILTTENSAILTAENNTIVAQSEPESVLADDKTSTSGEAQHGLSSNSGNKHDVNSSVRGTPEGCDTSATNHPHKPHLPETTLSPKLAGKAKARTIEKPSQAEKKKGPAQTESLSAFGKQVKSKGGKIKNKGLGSLKGKPKLQVDQGNKSLAPETVQPSLGRLDCTDTKVLPEMLTEPKNSTNVTELSKPTTSPAFATATATATAHEDEDEGANNDHNANDPDDKHMARRSSFFDRVKDITKTGQRSQPTSPATSPRSSHAIETTNESDRPVFWGKTSGPTHAIIQHIPGTVPLAQPGASHAVPVAELTDSGKIPAAAQPLIPEDERLVKADDIGLGISSVDGDGKGTRKSKPRKKKKKSGKKKLSAPASSVLDTESETRDDTSGIKSRSHSSETIALLDMATPESSTPSSPDVSATAASPSPSKAMMIAALKAKKESEQHLITASDSGTIKRKKQKKRVTSAPKTAPSATEQASDEDNVHTITILTTKRARESQDDVGRGVTVLSRLASSLGEQSQGGLLMSLLKDRDEKQDSGDEAVAGPTERGKIGDDDAESNNRIEELP